MTTPVYIIGLCLLCIAVLVTIIVKLSRKLAFTEVDAARYATYAAFAYDTIDNMLATKKVGLKKVSMAMSEIKKGRKEYEGIQIKFEHHQPEPNLDGQTRVCKCCGKEYPITDFEEVDGYRRRICKHCRNARKRVVYRDNTQR